MAKGMTSGLLWGGVLAFVGASVASLLSPLPEPPSGLPAVAASADATSEFAPETESLTQKEPALAVSPEPESEVVQAPEAAGPSAQGDETSQTPHAEPAEAGSEQDMAAADEAVVEAPAAETSGDDAAEAVSEAEAQAEAQAQAEAEVRIRAEVPPAVAYLDLPGQPAGPATGRGPAVPLRPGPPSSGADAASRPVSLLPAPSIAEGVALRVDLAPAPVPGIAPLQGQAPSLDQTDPRAGVALSVADAALAGLSDLAPAVVQPPADVAAARYVNPPAPAAETAPAPGPELADPTPSAVPATLRSGEPDEAGADAPAVAAEAVPQRPSRPQPGFAGQVAGVRVGRLPTVGSPASDPATPQTPPDAAEEVPAPTTVWQANARPFDNPGGLPPMAIILIDRGATDVDRAALAASGLPITLALDPVQPGAAAVAVQWRAAGQEVLILSSGLPAGGNASDYETAFEALSAAFPQVVGMLDAPLGGLQADRGAASVLIPALAARGLGLVTWDRGLNPADEVARQGGLVRALVFRELDAQGENASTIRRYLDRAVFRAAQEGQVVVAGRLRPETVEALRDWMQAGRISAVAPAPVTAIFARP